jgi:signal transduction histidine kinase
LRESAADRERLEMEILDVAARERSAFGRELHDELAQHFVATALAAQALAEKLAGREGTSEARAIVHWIEEGIAKTRKLARGLLLARIEPARFPQELAELAIAASRGSVQCRLQHEGPEIDADASRCAQLFRIAQEAVGNALRHARPRTIQITLASDEKALCLTVEDDGCGLPENPATGEGLGLRIMQHRARIIGATLSVSSAPGDGTRVVCRLPHGKFLSA